MKSFLYSVIIVLLSSLYTINTYASQNGDSIRTFTETQPLVYEDAWDLWPFAFLNEYGEPVGYNIDLLKLICKELDIPYIIKLKPTIDALNDLKSGQADLMCAMDADFHNDYGQYSKSVIHIFTHSIVHRNDEPVKVHDIKDLAHTKVIVHNGSFSHYLMKSRGWSNNAIPYEDMQEAIQRVHSAREGQILWNTLSLKWLLRKFNYTDMTISPVRIPHGEYKFMANNPRLLQKIDSVFTKLNAEGQLQPIQNKWFYPDRRDSGIPSWLWRAVGILMTIALLVWIYYFFYSRYEKRVTQKMRRSNDRLGIFLNTSGVHIWVFHVHTKSIIDIGKNGAPKIDEVAPSIFFNALQSEDFRHVMHALQHIAQYGGTKTLNVKSKEAADGTVRTLTIELSVLHSDKDGKPTDIIGTTRDTTEESMRQQQVKDSMLRYKSIFNTSLVDTVAYDENGIITDMNQKARNAFSINIDEIIKQNITIQEVLGMPDFDHKTMDYTYMTQLFYGRDDERALMRFLQRDELFYELQLLPVRDDNGNLLGIFGTGRDVTEIAKSYAREQENIIRLQEANDEMQSYIRNIDFVMKNGGVRIAFYSIDNHMMTIYSEIGHAQYTLTQARGVGLIADESKRMARRMLNSMDNETRTPINGVVKTILRQNHQPLYLYVSFIPSYDENGKLTGYLGMCRDISEIKALEEQLARESVKAQEVETIKNAFLRNMSYEIRTPLSSVVGFAELFEQEHTPEDEAFFIKEINDNSAKLLELINDILFLSRLDAGMIEFKTEYMDFSGFFEARCQTAWSKYQKESVTYLADSSYLQMVLEIDFQNLGVVIDHIVANAAQNTDSGQVHASYDYNGEDLIMSFQDTGYGIRADKLNKIFDRFETESAHGSGLGLSICHEIVKQMNGKIRIMSDVGKGTIVWVTIPCKCKEIVRK